MRKLLYIMLICLPCLVMGGSEFDGTNAYVVSDNFVLTNGTISGWIYPKRWYSTIQSIWSQETAGNIAGDSHWWMDSSGAGEDKLRFSLDDGGSTYIIYSDAKLPLDTLTHAVTTFGASGMKMYIDGVLQSDTDAYTGGMTNSSTLLLGLNLIGYSFYWQGRLDRFTIFPQALTSNEVYQLYISDGNEYPTNAAGYPITPTLDLTDAVGYGNNATLPDGTLIQDISGNGLHGTATNGVKYVDTVVPTNAAGFTQPFPKINQRNSRR